MPRAALIALLLASAPLPARAQDAPPAPALPTAARPEIDREPSEPAAVGFLRDFVDKRLYSIESLGARRLATRAHVLFEVTAAAAEQKSTDLDIDLAIDYSTGALQARPVKPPTPEQKVILGPAMGAAPYASSPLPSRAATQWKVALKRDGEEIRLDYKARVSSSPIESYSEWYKPDGTPLRRRMTSRVPKDGAVTTITQEFKLVHEERNGRLLLTEIRPIEAEGQFAYRFEYEDHGEVVLLKRLLQSNAGWKMTLDFRTKVEMPPPPAPQK